MQLQVKPEKLYESRVCVSVLLWCSYLELLRMKRDFQIAVFGMGVEFLLPGKPIPTGLWLLNMVSAGDFCACLFHAEIRLGLDSRLAQSLGPGRVLGSRSPLMPSARFSYSKEGVGELESVGLWES